MKNLHYTYYNRNYHAVDNKGIKFHIVLERYAEIHTWYDHHFSIFVVTKSGKLKGYKFSTNNLDYRSYASAVINKLLSELHPEYCDNTEKSEDVVLDLLSQTDLPKYLFTFTINKETNEVEYT